MKVINFFGGPGIGKSTCSANLFSKMKKEDYKVELVTEYAKDMVYEARYNTLEDQLYILAKQSRRVSRLKNQVDYVITDSPLLLTLIYNRSHESIKNIINELAIQLFLSYNNVNILLERRKKYQEYGRQQTLEEAIEIDQRLEKIFLTNDISYDILSSSENFLQRLKLDGHLS